MAFNFKITQQQPHNPTHGNSTNNKDVKKTKKQINKNK
ncbi:hypothetical Protein psc1_02610 [Candidatus Phytoplasma solani]